MAELDIGIPDISKAIAQAEKYLDITKQNTLAITEMAKALKSMTSANPLASAKDYNQIASAMKASQQALKDFNREKKNEQKLTEQLNSARDEEVKGRIRLQQATAEQKKILSEEVALENKSLGTKKRLQIENAKLTRSLDKLNLETKEGVAQAKEYIRQIDINNAKIKQFSSLQAQGKLTVGQYTDSINKAKIGMMNFASALGVATGLFAFTSALKGAFNIIRNNEDAFASLSAITGLTGDKFEVFKTAINNTATELKVSSTEVAEAAEKIASAQPKLLENADALSEVTKQAIILNKAIKGDLTETSLALVGVMNQFGASGEEAARIINILAAGSKAGAATVTQINESMVKFGTTAKILNVSIEESVGLIETLGEKAIFGAEAGTALKNVMLIMSSIDMLPPKALKQLEKYGVDTSIVTDTTISFSDRLKELSKIGQDTTAIMQVFGKENATAATVLLNSTDTLDNMTAAVTGTNVANEQMAVNVDTISGKLEEFSAKWENLVTEWANGKNVGEGVKNVIGFITDNLEEIIGWVFKGVKAWILYKSTLTLVNKEGTGMIQMFRNLSKGVKGATFSVGTLAKGLMGIVGIAAILIPIFIDIVKEIGEMISRTTALDRVTEKYNERIIEEKAKMDLLRVEVRGAIGDKEKMEGLIKRINATYGTTLKNIDDETQMMNQLWGAYQKVNAEMEKRIMQQLLEEELTELFKQKRAAEKALDDIGERTILNAVSFDFFSEHLSDTVDDINELQAELFKLDNGFKNLGARTKRGVDDPTLPKKKEPLDPKKGLTEEEKRLKRLADLRRDHANELIMFENEAIKAGYDRATIDNLLFMRKKELIEQELLFIQELNLKTTEEYDKTLNARLKMIDEEVKRLEKAKTEKIGIADEEAFFMNAIFKQLAEAARKAEEERIKALEQSIAKMQESAAALIQTIQDINNAKIDAIDVEIEQRKTEIQAHEDRVSEMKQLASEGVLVAEESIKAEEAKISALESSIAELEAKKQKLLTINLGLQTALNLAESGDPAAIAKAFGQVGDFVSGLQSFKEGTDDTGTGGNIDKDGGFLSILHPGEMVMEKELSEPFRKMGMGRQDIADVAMMKIHDDMVNQKSLQYGSFGDVMTLSALNGIKDGQEKVIDLLSDLPKKMPVNKLDYNKIQMALVEEIKINNEIKRYFTFLKK